MFIRIRKNLYAAETLAMKWIYFFKWFQREDVKE
jgi:hypothetical protein